MTEVILIDSEDIFSKILKTKNKLVVVNFSAKWCGPCKKFAPYYEKLAATMPNIIFTKLDIDEFEDIAKGMYIKTIPTFIFFKNGREIMRVSGNDLNAVIDACNKCQLM